MYICNSPRLLCNKSSFARLNDETYTIMLGKKKKSTGQATQFYYIATFHLKSYFREFTSAPARTLSLIETPSAMLCSLYFNNTSLSAAFFKCAPPLFLTRWHFSWHEEILKPFLSSGETHKARYIVLMPRVAPVSRQSAGATRLPCVPSRHQNQHLLTPIHELSFWYQTQSLWVAHPIKWRYHRARVQQAVSYFQARCFPTDTKNSNCSKFPFLGLNEYVLYFSPRFKES